MRFGNVFSNMRVIFTESQIKRLIGENFVSYLPNVGVAAEEHPNAYGTEVGISDKNDKGVSTDTVTTDEIGREETAKPFFKNRYGRYTKASVNALYESNSDFKGKSIKIPDTIVAELNNALSNSNDKNGKIRLTTLVTNKEVTPNDAYRILNDFKDAEFSENSVMPHSFLTFLKSQLGMLKSISKNMKQSDKDNGKENAFLKKNTKNNGGSAHSLKTDGISISFED